MISTRYHEKTIHETLEVANIEMELINKSSNGSDYTKINAITNNQQ